VPQLRRRHQRQFLRRLRPGSVRWAVLMTVYITTAAAVVAGTLFAANIMV
jgi:hypothetical protein